MIIFNFPIWLILILALAVLLVIAGGFLLVVASCFGVCLSYIWNFIKFIDRKLGELI